MRRILSLLPSATICVAKSEVENYVAAGVDRGKIIAHDELDALVHIWNWLQETIQEDCFVCIDDDLRWVRNLTNRNRKVTDPQVILEVIQNSHRVAADLGIGTFCWSRTQNTFLLRPDNRPIRFVQPISAAFGLRGSARERQFNPDYIGRADAEFSLRTLLEDRITYADCRWYFDVGRVFSGAGGNVGIMPGSRFAQATDRLDKNWGRYFTSQKPGYHKGKANNVAAMSIRVRRHNPLVKDG